MFSNSSDVFEKKSFNHRKKMRSVGGCVNVDKFQLSVFEEKLI